ncbi:MAG: SAM-dependent methyltransferase, partial [Prevotellaceae bacterium]|nr:SAM-dependent methyltransferase [Prevotellaceae bacterium]
MNKGKLYLIPAPLSDSDIINCIPEGVKRVVNSLRYFIVEDPRTARRYISKLMTGTPVAELNFASLNEHTDAREFADLLAPVLRGEDAGLMSDAGMPCIADPGEELVQLAYSRDITVVPLVGPSSLFLALAASGLSGEKFAFEGYLPAKTPELPKYLKRLEQSSRQEKQSKMFIETPYRSARMFETILGVCSPETL